MKKLIFKTLSIMIVAVFITVFFASCAKNEEVNDALVNRGNFATYIDASEVSFTVTPVDPTIAQGSDELAAIIHLMTVADANYVNADYLARISLGGGSASTGAGSTTMTGTMSVRSFNIREPGKTYDQSIGRVYEGDPQSLLPAAQALLNQGKRTLVMHRGEDNEIKYTQEPKNKGNPQMIDDFPYATLDFNKANVTSKLKSEEEPHDPDNPKYLKHPGELTNFVITADSILPESYSVEYDSDKKLYTAIFEIDLSDQAKRDAYTNIPRKDLRKDATSDDLEYQKYKVILKMWDNGLIQTYSTEEEWAATLKISFATLNGSSQSTNVVYYSWDRDDCKIDDYVEEGVIAIDWIS